MAASQVWLDTVANNLANANTTAFKRDEVGFEESFLRELRAANGAIIGDIQSGPKISQIATNFEMGSLQATGNALDVAISSPSGMFAVQTPTGVRYTRAGALSLNDQFELVDQNGYRVLNDQFAPIEVKGKGRILISQDGNVRAGDALAGKIAVFEGQFQKIGANLYDALGNTNANPDTRANTNADTDTRANTNPNTRANTND